MTRVTRASLAYVATQAILSPLTRFLFSDCSAIPQVRFSLSSAPVFSRTDTTTDSEGFYMSILSLLEDPDEAAEVKDLLTWWDRSVQH